MKKKNTTCKSANCGVCTGVMSVNDIFDFRTSSTNKTWRSRRSTEAPTKVSKLRDASCSAAYTCVRVDSGDHVRIGCYGSSLVAVPPADWLGQENPPAEIPITSFMIYGYSGVMIQQCRTSPIFVRKRKAAHVRGTQSERYATSTCSDYREA